MGTAPDYAGNDQTLAQNAVLAAYITKETGISMGVNTLFSLAFFLLLFAGLPHIPMASYAVDFMPQSFAIALMSTAVPGLIARQRRRKGLVPQLAGHTSRLPRHLLARAGLVAVLAGALAGGAMAGLSLLLLPSTLGWWPALAGKLAYGAALAALVTPPTLRAALA
jgi:hypothetical protein